MKHRKFFTTIQGAVQAIPATLKVCIVTVFAATLSLSSVHSLPWSWDMWSQDSIEPYEEPVLFPRNSISTDGGKTKLEDRNKVELIEKGPIPRSGESEARGEKVFKEQCVVCHGPEGAGDGIIIKKGLGFYPVNLTTPAVAARTDGYIYAYIRYGGKVMMPSYSENISEKDSWHVVNYIRKLQDPAPAKENQ
ncbi:MAG: c-type cytochrome [Candidatus Dadabacteria bacterium]|nr:c-type cytochrome [Candidatus Dadabacteria bacterium]